MNINDNSAILLPIGLQYIHVLDTINLLASNSLLASTQLPLAAFSQKFFLAIVTHLFPYIFFKLGVRLHEFWNSYRIQ